MECLRSKSAQELNDAAPSPRLGHNFLTYGTDLLPTRPQEALRRGELNADVDLIFGVLEDEASIFIALLNNDFGGDAQGFLDFAPGSITSMSKNKAEKYIDTLMTGVEMFNKKEIAAIQSFYLDRIFEQYRAKCGSNDAYRKAVSRSVGDLVIVAPTIVFGGLFSKWANLKGRNTYAYRLTYLMRIWKMMILCVGWMGICHSAEMPAVFGFAKSSWLPFYSDRIVYSRADREFSAEIMRVWSEFARTG